MDVSPMWCAHARDLPAEIDATAGRAALSVSPVGDRWWRADRVHWCIVDHPRPPEADVWLPAPTVRGRIPVRRFHQNGRLWEIEFWRSELIDGLIQMVEVEGAPDPPMTIPLTTADLRILDSIDRAIPLKGEELVHVWQRRLAGSCADEIVSRGFFEHVERYIEIAMGFLTSGCTRQALLSGLESLEYAIDGFLAHHGHLLPDPAERYERYARVLASIPQEKHILSPDDYWSLQTMRDLDPDDPARWLDRTLEACLAFLECGHADRTA